MRLNPKTSTLQNLSSSSSTSSPRTRRKGGFENDRPWSVRWDPIGGGTYPQFEGKLAIDIAENGRACALVIEGEYAPPLGAAGQVFDSVLGSRVASITAREFLRTVATQIQHEHTLEQALELP
jgi:hypothetical protein